MAEQGFEISRWVEKLATCLRELVDYERWIEEQFLLMRHRVQFSLGLSGDAPRNSTDYIRERIRRLDDLQQRLAMVEASRPGWEPVS